jgi:outer membrane protein
VTENIQVAYYRYLGAAKAVAIYASAVKLAEEGKRINESLLANGKSLKAYVIRSESELQTLESKRKDALLLTENAKMYFNFLLNVDPAQEIDTAYALEPDIAAIESYLAKPTDISRREELQMLQTATTIQDYMLSMNKSYWHPKINGFLDLGSQASDFAYDSDSRFYLLGVQLEIPIFAAGKNHFKVRQSEMDYQQRLLENTHATRQIQLAADVARNDLSTSYENYKASLKQLESANAYYKLIERGYREGINSFIESIDARNQVTYASLQVVLERYSLFSKLATYKRELSL